jgi:hypothetical protein
MWHDRMNKLRRILGFRMAYGDVIPPEARVDPAQFPEEKYPLSCPKCDYLLRGLPQDRCPECGSEYERGRLLVQQYVIEGGKRITQRSRRFANRALIIGFLFFFAPMALITLLASLMLYMSVNTSPVIDWLMSSKMRFLAPISAGLILMLVSALLNLRTAAKTHKKCKSVFEGLDREVPAYRKVQRYKGILWLGPVVAGFIMLTCEHQDVTQAYRQYSRSPEELLLPLGLACGLGLIIYIGHWLWNRWTHDDEDRPSDT